MKTQTYLMPVVLFLSFLHTDADANVRGGGRVGGVRVGASTSFRPGAGVTRSTTIAAGRHHVPATLPGVGAPGSAIRTARHVAGRVARRTARGISYYLGAPIVVLPAPSCYAVMWEGMTAYNCGGVLYLFENGQYFPIEGI